MNKSRFLLYGSVAGSIFLVDRLTKAYALNHFVDEQVITPFLSFFLILNRGVSWSMFNSSSSILFIAVTALVLLITSALGWYAYSRHTGGKLIVGELLILAGSVSNLIDRFLYGGVVDFIMVHAGEYVWPLFNVADSAIVVGVSILFYNLFIYRKN